MLPDSNVSRAQSRFFLKQANGRFLTQASFQLAADRRRVLLRPGSLSKRLQQWCQGELPVAVVHQGRGLPTRDEARLLGLRSRTGIWVREVLLGPAHQPWVTARTVAPLQAMQGPLHFLRNLGSRPLGSVLFMGRAWGRGPFLLGKTQGSDNTDCLPARRSIFCQGRTRLLITESFCPAFWQRLQQEQEEQRRPLTANALPATDPFPETP